MPNTLTMTISDNPRGVCDICGKPAYAPQAKKCAEHRGAKSKTASERRADSIDDAIRRQTGGDGSPPDPDIRITPPSSPAPPDPAQAKSDRAKYLGTYIEREINPLLAQGMAFLCQPVPAVNFYREEGDTIIPQHFGQRVALAKPEAWLMAHAVAELEGNPMLTTVTKTAAPILPFVFAAGGVFLIGAKAYSIWNLREQILTKWKTENDAEAPGQEQHTEAQRAAQEAESKRQATTVAAEEHAQAVRAAAAEDESQRMGHGNATRPELADIDLGQPGEPAVDPDMLPDVAAAAEAELAEALNAS